MQQTRDLLLPVVRLTPDGGQFFFGYYDVPAWSADDQCHLCHKVAFRDRLPVPDDVATLGVIRLDHRAFLPFAETTAWNFQQGSMLQWHPAAPNDEVVFNRRESGRFVGVVRNVHTGQERPLSRPVAAVSPKGDYALSINFSRVFDFRPGYGYAGIPDPFGEQDHPDDDGVFLVDLKTGESRLIISLRDIYEAAPDAVRGQSLVINHITFNTDGSRFVFLSRNNPRRGEGGWKTAIFTADATGRELYLLSRYAMASHYNWRDPKHLLCYCDAVPQTYELYLLSDKSDRSEALDPAFFVRDGHCSYSPDRRWLLYDGYPIDGYRYLYVYDLERRKGVTLGGFRSDPVDIVDIRCDLHPRWNSAGTMISFDSTHEGSRHVYSMDLTPLISRA